MNPKEIYMVTASGRRLYPFDLTPDQIDEESIARHLATEARWSGATRHPVIKDRIFYSVAEHSIYVANFLRDEMDRPDLYLAGLLHDAPEYVVGDQIRPLKYSPSFREPFKQLEESVEKVIFDKYSIPFPLPKEVKIADDAVARAEWEQIVPRTSENEEWVASLADHNTAANITIHMLQPYEAYQQFITALSQTLYREGFYGYEAGLDAA